MIMEEIKEKSIKKINTNLGPVMVNITNEALAPFGVISGQRVLIYNKIPATIEGVDANDSKVIWLTQDEDHGESRWLLLKDKEVLISL
jgi:hypothetical protein